MKKTERKKGKIWIIIGLLLLAAALFLTAFNLYDARRAAGEALLAADRLEALIPPSAAGSGQPETAEKEAGLPETEMEIPDYLLNPEMDMPERELDGIRYIGILRIPSLSLELSVISSLSYPNLRHSPCRYAGSAYTGSLIIAGHNYPSHFGLLKNLQEGDSLSFTDTDGNTFLYRVRETEILQPADLQEMESGDWDLTLFTCTVGGKSRVTVRCEQTDSAAY